MSGIVRSADGNKKSPSAGSGRYSRQAQEEVNQMEEKGKSLFKSKTFWVNVLAIVGMIIQSFTGFVIDAGTQVVILGVVNTVLRFVTHEAIEW